MKMIHSVNTASALRSMPRSNSNRPPKGGPLQQLFLTPDSDPWLGLVPRDTYTALEANGLVQAVKR